MAGYKVTTVESVKGAVICPHCGLLLRDAVQTGEGIRLCESCYKEIAANLDRTCPRCGITVDGEGKYWPDRAVRRDILELLVKCNYYQHGCPWEGQLKHLDSHCQECRFRPVQCPNEGCSELLTPDRMDKHIDEECLYRRVSCEHCQQQCLATHLKDHYEQCPKYPLQCERCSTQVLRDQLDDHLDNYCSKVECAVPKCGDLLHRKGAERNEEERLQSTHEHLDDPDKVFWHIQKLGVFMKSNHKRIAELQSQYKSLVTTIGQEGVTPAMISTIQSEIERNMRVMEKRLSKLEGIVETARLGRDKNVSTKVEDLQEKVRYQNDRILQLEQMMKQVQSQCDKQSRNLTQLQQQQQTVPGWKLGDNRTSFEATGAGSFSDSRMMQLEKKLEEIERQTAMVKVHVSELELQLQASLASTHNGAFLWRIPEVSRRKRDAIEERITSIYSPPFYTGRNGYKMCIRAYLNGDGIGYKTHLSIFFVLMKGEYDPLLKWPFDYKVSLILVDQNHRKHVVQTFKPTPESSSFQRPRSDMNVASGCPQFSKLSVLDDENYVKDEVLYIKCIVDTTRIFHP